MSELIERQFIEYYLQDSEESAIGLIEKVEGEIASIYSIYFDTCLSVRDLTVAIYDNVYNSLGINEIASVGMNRYQVAKGFHVPFSGKLGAYYAGYDKEHMRDPLNLVKDAIKRKSTIKERGMLNGK